MACEHCSGVQNGPHATCPACGRGLAWYQPSKAQIAEACEAIQATWTKFEEHKRRQVKNPAAETAVAIRVTDHMRRNQEID